MLTPIWRLASLSIHTKAMIFRGIPLYGAECWKTTVTIKQKLQVFQTKCLRGSWRSAGWIKSPRKTSEAEQEWQPSKRPLLITGEGYGMCVRCPPTPCPGQLYGGQPKAKGIVAGPGRPGAAPQSKSWSSMASPCRQPLQQRPEETSHAPMVQSPQAPDAAVTIERDNLLFQMQTKNYASITKITNG